MHESSTTAIIFSRFQLAKERSESTSYMPPPLNVLVMPLVLVFYLVEITINAIRRCFGKQERYNLLLLLIPPFLKARKLEIDEQLLYKNCKRYWRITTNEGEKYCKMTKYNQTTMVCNIFSFFFVVSILVFCFFVNLTRNIMYNFTTILPKWIKMKEDTKGIKKLWYLFKIELRKDMHFG